MLLLIFISFFVLLLILLGLYTQWKVVFAHETIPNILSLQREKREREREKLSRPSLLPCIVWRGRRTFWKGVHISVPSFCSIRIEFSIAFFASYQSIEFSAWTGKIPVPGLYVSFAFNLIIWFWLPLLDQKLVLCVLWVYFGCSYWFCGAEAVFDSPFWFLCRFSFRLCLFWMFCLIYLYANCNRFEFIGLCLRIRFFRLIVALLLSCYWLSSWLHWLWSSLLHWLHCCFGMVSELVIVVRFRVIEWDL